MIVLKFAFYLLASAFVTMCAAIIFGLSYIMIRDVVKAIKND